mmetsp:Transcript_5474/g.8922  ORF Transcript_5474/g.8922 Transcript_5474/m.8922 type:complete len:259 (+) Transcript_5474:663-1439(+)
MLTELELVADHGVTVTTTMRVNGWQRHCHIHRTFTVDRRRRHGYLCHQRRLNRHDRGRRRLYWPRYNIHNGRLQLFMHASCFDRRWTNNDNVGGSRRRRLRSAKRLLLCMPRLLIELFSNFSVDILNQTALCFFSVLGKDNINQTATFFRTHKPQERIVFEQIPNLFERLIINLVHAKQRIAKLVRFMHRRFDLVSFVFAPCKLWHLVPIGVLCARIVCDCSGRRSVHVVNRASMIVFRQLLKIAINGFTLLPRHIDA